MGIVDILIWILFGALAGWVAGKLMGSSFSLLVNIILGIVGSVVGGLLAGPLGIKYEGGFSLGAFLVAVAGAVVVIVLARLLSGKKV